MKQNRKFCAIELFAPIKQIRLLLALVMFNWGTSIAQGQTPDNARISFPESAYTLQEVIAEIERQSQYVFVFDAALQELQSNVRIAESALSVNEILEVIQEQHAVKFQRDNYTITVYKAPSVPSKPASKLREIKGIIKDETGLGMPGVSVFIPESTTGTVTDMEGLFSLNVPFETKFLFATFLGYEKKQLDIVGLTFLDIQMEPALTALDEVVVTGYTRQRVRDITGSVAVINGEKIKNIPVVGVDQALQGQAAGVQVINDGAPGSPSAVRIRGYGTLGDNDPLYIVDGVPVKDNINQIPIGDIESIQVLKDAAATAIYGSRASNGVIIITTKQGVKEGMRVSFNAYEGIQIARNLPTMLNTEDYARLLWEADRNAGNTPSNDLFGNGPNPVIPAFIDNDSLIPASLPGTQWFQELFRPASMRFYDLSVATGSKNFQNYSSVSYLNQDGIMQHTGFERYTLRTNSTLRQGKLETGINLSLSLNNLQSVPTNRALGSRMIHAYRMNPVVPVYDINGNFAGPVSGVEGALNPVALNYLDRHDLRRTTRILGNVYVQYELASGLVAKAALGTDYQDYNTKNYEFKYKMGDTQLGETSFFQLDGIQNQIVLNSTLQYKKYWGQHLISAVAGNEAIRFTLQEAGGSSSGFVTDDINYIRLDNGTGQSSNFSNGTAWALLSQFAKVDYQFNEKYLVSASLRRDGSSRFSEQNRYAFFPAFALGWNMIQNNPADSSNRINSWKWRLSWGQSGNQEIGDFTSFSTYSSSAWDTYYAIDGSNTQATLGFKPTRIGNPEVRWEATSQADFGADVVLFQYLQLTLDYFHRTTSGILLQQPTLAIEGQADAPFVNLGEMTNSGIEFSAQFVKEIKKDFSISLGGNISNFRNEVTRLAPNINQLTGEVNNTYSRNLTLSVTQVGSPIAQFYGHIVDGIFQSQEEVAAHAQQPGKGIGRLKYRDLNGDGLIDDNDRTIIGNPHPDFIYGITLGANFRRWELNILLQGVQGVDVYNFTRYYTDFYYDLGNRSERILTAWTPANTDTDVPRVSTVDVNNELRPSTYFIEDGSYLRCRNLRVAYAMPLRKDASRNMIIYAQAQNLFTITGYEGIDPEVGLVNATNDNRNLDIGVDRGIYPNSTTFLLGINLRL